MIKCAETSEDLKTIQKILQQWDPIDVIESLKEDGIPPNEYDSYAPAILTMLMQGASVENITHHLGVIQKVSMGLDPWPDRDRRIATMLVEWWNSGR
jgi:hypothetical protein